ncbi:MAG: bifunctional phosphopantothenoylcysteine decarboxylase/phosphopantothenate--cysteine ligase CoaBC [Actinobacteria bacterium]|nr:bifunctional phosphopantothenoylcysteine decarboxylase/phosphopantothenate--cysteine ligase CoaBC [Actinomycetota bacterium]
MARVLVGVTGGIAAYKACELVRLLVRAGHEVIPLVTPGAERFVRAETFNALARRNPETSLYPHLERVDLYVISPLTANTLAKLAHGLADNLVTEAALAHDGPLLVAPATNTRMWRHPATQANLELIVARGVKVVGPSEGDLAEGGQGLGRMAEPEEIFARCQALLGPSNSLLQGRRVVVTAGATREPIDAVRFVGNRSSGRMGVALAEEARRRGAEVTLIGSNLAVAPPGGVPVVHASTAADLRRETLALGDADVVVMAAAVGDYRPSEPRGDKRPKDGEVWRIDLQPNDDVLSALGRQSANGRILVGFAAETGEDGLARARTKRTGKNADLVVYNDVARKDIGFESPDNEVVLISEAGERKVEKAPKARIAAEIFDEVERLMETDGGRASG